MAESAAGLISELYHFTDVTLQGRERKLRGEADCARLVGLPDKWRLASTPGFESVAVLVGHGAINPIAPPVRLTTAVASGLRFERRDKNLQWTSGTYRVVAVANFLFAIVGAEFGT
jgi:hypothetical protein